MQALGFVETKGLIAAIESADAMLKSADVKLLEKTYVGGGLVSIAVTGDVGAVKAAVEAGVAAVRKIDEKLLISQHIIPRPHEELASIIVTTKPSREEVSLEEIEKTKNDSEKTNISLQIDFSKVPDKEAIDKMVLEYSLEQTIKALKKFKVVELRNLAREYKDFGIKGRKISKANKKLLIAEFREYYKK
ncbi:BMC domain-containing protein [Crassaminicella indica]|uniref:BMC domain-containing protein n=1 Tax=Crassaminicella indica TaxID=2855394 RepID=A0ABX8RBL3_9CLOT|nr:BMC domain-containing protein [Crassaminicella indica]QXM05110.1 BMC domain-containing protein [Crassaminicella indica]